MASSRIWLDKKSLLYTPSSTRDNGRRDDHNQTALALTPAATEPMEDGDGPKIDVFREQTTGNVASAEFVSGCTRQVLTPEQVADSKQTMMAFHCSKCGKDFKYSFAKTASASFSNHLRRCGGLKNEKEAIASPEETLSRLSPHADHRQQTPNINDVAFDSVGKGSHLVKARVKVEETTGDIRERHPANERDDSAPVVQTHEFVSERKPRSAILLVAILVPIALLLANIVSLRLRLGILAFLFLLPTINVIMYATKTNRVEEGATMATVTPMPTLREFLSHPDGFHMSFAPAFFGFFAYFGALAAMEEETNGLVVPKFPAESQRGDVGDATNGSSTCHRLQSVSGASAGAMAAVMLAAGIQPRDAAEFAFTVTWGMVADPPGCGGYVKGNYFEEAMRTFIRDHSAKNRICSPPAVGDDGEGPGDPAAGAGLRLEEGLVPVAVSAFDLMRMRGTILIRGCMARAARSSAGFPGLFQPVAWRGGHHFEDSRNEGKSWLPDSLLIDGGITDGLGLNGLGALSFSDAKTKRVINLVVGDFGFKGPGGIEDVPAGVNAEYLVSLRIIGTPLCGPWAMTNGPRAFESARKAVADALDKPMVRGTCANHHIICVNASQWLE
jgi:hypothetical protein